MGSAAIFTSSQLRSTRAPISQVMISAEAKGVGARLIIKLVSDPVRLESTTPASVNMIRLPERPASSESRAMPQAAPVNAKTGSR